MAAYGTPGPQVWQTYHNKWLRAIAFAMKRTAAFLLKPPRECVTPFSSLFRYSRVRGSSALPLGG
jgi:hypothetical protein